MEYQAKPLAATLGFFLQSAIGIADAARLRWVIGVGMSPGSVAGVFYGVRDAVMLR